MGKFDGILILSDIDGTFAGEDTIAVNSRAVKYFTDNGGKFSFATGRGTSHVRQPQFYNVINAPVCLYNGGIIYDFEKECTLYERSLEITVSDFIKAIYGQRDMIAALNIFDRGSGDCIKFSDISSVSTEVLSLKPIKIVCVFEKCDSADKFKHFAEQHSFFNSCFISKSWNVGVEFNAFDATKGRALDFIKNYLGNIHTSVGIGDYENDIPLLKHADIGVAVGNATEEVKRAADVIVKPCGEFAIKDLIENLDSIIK